MTDPEGGRPDDSARPADVAVAGRDLLRVVALRDPAVERAGHHPRSNYVELFYLGFLGPSVCEISSTRMRKFSFEWE